MGASYVGSCFLSIFFASVSFVFGAQLSTASAVAPSFELVSVGAQGELLPSNEWLVLYGLGGGSYLRGKVVSTSHDGRFVAFKGQYPGLTPEVSSSDQNTHLYVKDMLTGAVTHIDSNVTFSGISITGVVISGNGEWIAYYKNYQGPSVLQKPGKLTLYQRRTGIKQEYMGLTLDDLTSDIDISYDGSVLAFATISRSSSGGSGTSYQYTVHVLDHAQTLSSATETKITQFSNPETFSSEKEYMSILPGYVKIALSTDGSGIAFTALGGTRSGVHDLYYTNKSLTDLHKVSLSDVFGSGLSTPISSVYITPDSRFVIAANSFSGTDFFDSYAQKGFLAVDTMTGETMKGYQTRPLGTVGDYLITQDTHESSREWIAVDLVNKTQFPVPVDDSVIADAFALSGDGNSLIFVTPLSLSQRDKNTYSDLYSQKVELLPQSAQSTASLKAAFLPATVSRGGRTTFSVILSNPSDQKPRNNAAFTYRTPPNTQMAVAPTGTCIGFGTKVNFSVVTTTVSGISLPPGGSCTLQMSIFAKIALGEWTGTFSELSGVTVDSNPTLVVR